MRRDGNICHLYFVEALMNKDRLFFLFLDENAALDYNLCFLSGSLHRALNGELILIANKYGHMLHFGCALWLLI